MTIQSIEAQLKKIDRQRERLHRELETRKRKQFTSLPAKVGLKNVDQLILSLAAYASAGLRTRFPGTAAAAKTPARRSTSGPSVKKSGTPARRNTRYTEQQKDAVKTAVAKGGETVAEMSRRIGVAEYTIIDWKKKWGLVRKRKKTPAKKK